MNDWLREKIAPMLAGSSLPFDSDEHLFEVKWDGIRALGFFGPGVVRIQGRKLGDSSYKYPEIVKGLEKLPGNGILDGEIVVLDDGRPDFQRVLVREQTTRRDAAAARAKEHPAVYMAFDLLFRDGKPLFDLPLEERKKRLAVLLRNAPSPLVENAYVIRQGIALYEQARERGLEGIVAKRLSSRYFPGERSRDWLKLKVRRTTDGVLAGLVREKGTNRVRSLVLGGYAPEGDLVWLGNVGSGLDQATIRELGTELASLRVARGPFEAAAPGVIEWLEPRLVVRVEYMELTNEDRLRHPVFVGFVKKDPKTCAAPRR